MKKLIFLLLGLLLLLSCNNAYNKNNKNLKKIEIEKQLLALKNLCFIEFLSKIEKKNNQNCNNYSKDYSMGVYIQISDIDLHYIFEDKNRQKLINRWLNKNYPKTFELNIELNDNDDIKNINLNKMLSIDFYNSNDLNKYIDSVRTIEYKKYKIN